MKKKNIQEEIKPKSNIIYLSKNDVIVNDIMIKTSMKKLEKEMENIFYEMKDVKIEIFQININNMLKILERKFPDKKITKILDLSTLMFSCLIMKIIFDEFEEIKKYLVTYKNYWIDFHKNSFICDEKPLLYDFVNVIVELLTLLIKTFDKKEIYKKITSNIHDHVFLAKFFDTICENVFELN